MNTESILKKAIADRINDLYNRFKRGLLTREEYESLKRQLFSGVAV